MKRRIAQSVLIGCALGALPALPVWYSMGGTIVTGLSLLLMPGMFVSMAFDRGNIHDQSMALLVAGNCVFYTLAAYLLIRRW